MRRASEAIEIQKIFVLLDRALWLAWLALPVIAWLTYQAVMTPSAFMVDLAKISTACADLLPQVEKFSSPGKVAVAIFFVLEFAVYAVILALAHLTIHKFAQGQMFVAGVLRALGQLGLVVSLWPFYSLISENLLNYIATRTGDIRVFQPNYILDVAPLGVGLLIITLWIAFRRAIAMKQENDLTI